MLICWKVAYKNIKSCLFVSCNNVCMVPYSALSLFIIPIKNIYKITHEKKIFRSGNLKCEYQWNELVLNHDDSFFTVFTIPNTNVTQFVCEWLLFLFVFHIKSPLFNRDPDAEKTTSPASWGQGSSRAVTGRPAASSRGQCGAVQGGSRFLHCYTTALLHCTTHSLLHSSLHTQWSVTGNSGLHYKSSRPHHLKIASERGLGAQEQNYQAVSIGHGVSVKERPIVCWYCQTGGKQTNFVDDELEMCVYLVSTVSHVSWTGIYLVNERWGGNM